MDQKLARKQLTQIHLAGVNRKSYDGLSKGGGEEGSIAGLSRKFPRTKNAKAMTKSSRRIQSKRERGHLQKASRWGGFLLNKFEL